MAITVTVGGASSNSYITLAEWQTYWTARNIDLTAHGHDDSHNANLVQAADFLDRNYSWVGTAQYQTQSMAWPRITNVYVDGWPINEDTIPQRLKDAQAELAYLIHEGLTPWATITGSVKRTMAKAGPVETETEYLGGKTTPRLRAIEGLIAPLLNAGVGQVRLGRG